jgi:hypothetical protein
MLQPAKSDRGKTMKINYQQKYTTRQTKSGPRKFGPYWYAFWRDGTKVKCRYIGAKLNETILLAIKIGQASVNRLPVNLPGQTKIDFAAAAAAAAHGYEPIICAPHCGREAARKVYFFRLKRKNVTAHGRELYSRDFALLCSLRGWEKPRVK